MAETEDRIRICLARVEGCHARAVSTPHERAKKEFLLIEAEWRTLAREIKDMERSRKFVADAESSMRRRYEAALQYRLIGHDISRPRRRTGGSRRRRPARHAAAPLRGGPGRYR